MLDKMKFKINKNNLNTNITFNLDVKDITIGTQKDIDDFIQYETNNAINPIINNDVLLFTPNSGTTLDYRFFYFNDLGIPSNTITNLGITEFEAKGNIGKNSFYLLEFFDNYDSRYQNKIFQTYLISLKNKVDTTYIVDTTTNKELYTWYVPESGLNSLLLLSGNTTTSTTIYCKFSFYNAKDGKFTYFYNPTYGDISNEIRNYFITTLNIDDLRYSIVDINEITEIVDNDMFTDSLQNNINPTPIYKPTYPDGNSTVISGDTIIYVNN